MADNGIFSLGDETFEFGNATLTNVAPLLPGGAGLSMPVLSVGPVASGSSPSLINSFLIYQPDLLKSKHSPITSPIAYTLDFYLCIQTYNTTVTDGTTYTYVTSSQPFNAEVRNETSGQFSLTGAKHATTSVDDIDFSISQSAFGQLNSILQSSVTDNCYEELNKSAGAGMGLNAQGQWCEFTTGATLLNGLNSPDPLSAVNQTMQNIAISLTNT